MGLPVRGKDWQVLACVMRDFLELHSGRNWINVSLFRQKVLNFKTFCSVLVN